MEQGKYEKFGYRLEFQHFRTRNNIKTKDFARDSTLFYYFRIEKQVVVIILQGSEKITLLQVHNLILKPKALQFLLSFYKSFLIANIYMEARIKLFLIISIHFLYSSFNLRLSNFFKFENRHFRYF